MAPTYRPARVCPASASTTHSRCRLSVKVCQQFLKSDEEGQIFCSTQRCEASPDAASAENVQQCRCSLRRKTRLAENKINKKSFVAKIFRDLFFQRLHSFPVSHRHSHYNISESLPVPINMKSVMRRIKSKVLLKLSQLSQHRFNFSVHICN